MSRMQGDANGDLAITGHPAAGVAVVVADVQVEEHPAQQVAQADGGLRAVAADQSGAGGQARAAFLRVLAIRNGTGQLAQVVLHQPGLRAVGAMLAVEAANDAEACAYSS